MKGVFEATMDDALGPDRLAGSQRGGFGQGDAVAAAVEIIQKPQAGSTATENQDIHG